MTTFRAGEENDRGFRGGGEHPGEGSQAAGTVGNTEVQKYRMEISRGETRHCRGQGGGVLHPQIGRAGTQHHLPQAGSLSRIGLDEENGEQGHAVPEKTAPPRIEFARSQGACQPL